MPFFQNLMNATPRPDQDASRVILVMTETDMEALESLLAKVPYEHAAPIVRAFRDASELQRRGQILDVVEQVLDLHRSAVAYRDRNSIEDAFN
ncbi:MAG: hypothetical protein QM780_06920 [Hyphomicrobium sp.]|uniref:hypothetical protein n=1 Tax=Hyphomicrobium sp. TaxID=82 RepID=UPI0039E3884A